MAILVRQEDWVQRQMPSEAQISGGIFFRERFYCAVRGLDNYTDQTV